MTPWRLLVALLAVPLVAASPAAVADPVVHPPLVWPHGFVPPPVAGRPCTVTFGALATATPDSEGTISAALVLAPTGRVPQLVQMRCDIEYTLLNGSLCDIASLDVFGIGPLITFLGPAKVSAACGDQLDQATACTTVTAIYGPTPVTIEHHDLGCTSSTNQAQVVDDTVGAKPLGGAIVLSKVASGAPLVWRQLGAFETWDCDAIDEATGSFDPDGNAVLCQPLASGGDWYCETWAVLVATVGSTAHARGSAQCEHSPEVQTVAVSGTNAASGQAAQVGPTAHVRWARCSAYDRGAGKADPTFHVVCFEPPNPVEHPPGG